jgi:hypothetical protein
MGSIGRDNDEHDQIDEYFVSGKGQTPAMDRGHTLLPHLMMGHIGMAAFASQVELVGRPLLASVNATVRSKIGQAEGACAASVAPKKAVTVGEGGKKAMAAPPQNAPMVSRAQPPSCDPKLSPSSWRLRGVRA